MRVHIFYGRLLDLTGTTVTVGGVQTYILSLIRLLSDVGCSVSVFQRAARDFEVRIDGATVVGLRAANRRRVRQQAALLVAAAREAHRSENPIEIFAADHFSVPTVNPRAISIQHGVSWDLPLPIVAQSKPEAILRQCLYVWRARRNFQNCPNRVCVDYNFLNWYRTVFPRLSARLWVIPNFCHHVPWEEVSKAKCNPGGTTRILFARRFYDYRGTKIMAEVAKVILRDNPQVQFTFAGAGPDEQWLRMQFAGDGRVRFLTYVSPTVGHRIHLEHDIAVIPSLGSEGTSFSVAEAMGSGCALVATNVGGITNMILDGYNGLLVMPTVEQIVGGISRLLANAEERQRIARNAWDVANTAFSERRWRESWLQVLETVGRHSSPA